MSRLRSQRRLPPFTPCGYCFQEWAVCWDHVKPVNSGGSNSKENLYPACQRCNLLVSAMVFDSLEEKRAWIQAELQKRGDWRSADQMRDGLVTTKGDAKIKISYTSMWVVCSNLPCDAMFQPERKNHKYCSSKCRITDWERLHPRTRFPQAASSFPQDLPLTTESDAR